MRTRETRRVSTLSTGCQTLTSPSSSSSNRHRVVLTLGGRRARSAQPPFNALSLSLSFSLLVDLDDSSFFARRVESIPSRATRDFRFPTPSRRREATVARHLESFRQRRESAKLRGRVSGEACSLGVRSPAWNPRFRPRKSVVTRKQK